MIENFSLLSPEEQQRFADELLAKLNAQKVFSDDSVLESCDIDADEMTGSLHIAVGIDAAIDREASWTCGDSDDADRMPDDYDFTNGDDDAAKAFKTLTTEFEGYILELVDSEISDCDVEEVASVDNIEYADAGIGHYEFWGETGYDSQPYCEVEGTLAANCGISAWLVVTAK